jgi:hypothetical protein
MTLICDARPSAFEKLTRTYKCPKTVGGFVLLQKKNLFHCLVDEKMLFGDSESVHRKFWTSEVRQVAQISGDWKFSYMEVQLKLSVLRVSELDLGGLQ